MVVKPSWREDNTRQKLNCLYVNTMANHFLTNWILNNLWIAKLQHLAKDSFDQTWSTWLCYEMFRRDVILISSHWFTENHDRWAQLHPSNLVNAVLCLVSKLCRRIPTQTLSFLKCVIFHLLFRINLLAFYHVRRSPIGWLYSLSIFCDRVCVNDSVRLLKCWPVPFAFLKCLRRKELKSWRLTDLH